MGIEILIAERIRWSKREKLYKLRCQSNIYIYISSFGILHILIVYCVELADKRSYVQNIHKTAINKMY